MEKVKSILIWNLLLQITKKQIEKNYEKKITYSSSKSEKLDLLDIIEMHLLRSVIKL